MMNRIMFFVVMLSVTTFLTSCGNDDDIVVDTTGTFDLNISGLEDLGADYVYEGWLIVDGSPVTTGIFTIDGDGNLSSNSFTAEQADITIATTFVLTIEPAVGDDPAPSPVHILAGDFSNGTADLTVGHPAALNDSFESIAGKYIMATPSDGMDNNETSGLWFLDLASGAPAEGMTLPTLPEGWAYEGWAVIDGVPVSTGTFLTASGADASAPYSGTMGVPPFPGEDFIMNAPTGLTFPTDITGGSAVISIEPVPDNSAAPFTLKPLVGMIDAGAADHVTFEMGQNLVFPTGSAVK